MFRSESESDDAIASRFVLVTLSNSSLDESELPFVEELFVGCDGGVWKSVGREGYNSVVSSEHSGVYDDFLFLRSHLSKRIESSLRMVEVVEVSVVLTSLIS